MATEPLAEAIVRDALAHFACARLAVVGDCMSPALRAGDVVSIVGVAARRPRLHDIVLVWADSGPRLHRLVWGPPLARGDWRTKADGGALWDSRVSPADVVGSVVAVERTGSGTTTAVGRGWRAGWPSLVGGALFWLRERSW